MKKITYTVVQDSDAKNLVYEFNLAGKGREDVRVSLKSKQIHLSVNGCNYTVNPEDNNWCAYEIVRGRTNPLDLTNIKASMKNGLLTVKVPFAVQEEKQITID